MPGQEFNGGIALCFENVLVHFLIPRMATAVSAGGIDDDVTTGCTSRWIEIDCSRFELELPMHGVENIAESKFDRSLGGIELNCFLCAAGLSQEKRAAQNRCRNAERTLESLPRR